VNEKLTVEKSKKKKGERKLVFKADRKLGEGIELPAASACN